MKLRKLLLYLLLIFVFSKCIFFPHYGLKNYAKKYKERVRLRNMKMVLWRYQLGEKQGQYRFFSLPSVALDSNFLFHLHFDMEFYTNNPPNKKTASLPGVMGPEDTIRYIRVKVQNQANQWLTLDSLLHHPKGIEKDAYGYYSDTVTPESDSLYMYYNYMHLGVLSLSHFREGYNNWHRPDGIRLRNHRLRGLTLESKLASSDFFAKSKQVMFKAEVAFTNGRVLVDSVILPIKKR